MQFVNPVFRKNKLWDADFLFIHSVFPLIYIIVVENPVENVDKSCGKVISSPNKSALWIVERIKRKIAAN